jgi:Pyridine nucleotide-disulphide oxidoreductase
VAAAVGVAGTLQVAAERCCIVRCSSRACGQGTSVPQRSLFELLLQVTLIDQSERFVFKPLLYDFVAGTAKAWEVAPYFQQLLAPYNINFLQVALHCNLLCIRLMFMQGACGKCLLNGIVAHILSWRPSIGDMCSCHGSAGIHLVTHLALLVHRQGTVNAVEPEKLLPDGGSAAGGRITLADGQHVEYDWLVLALGSETSTFGIPGAKELATPFCTYADALKVQWVSVSSSHILLEAKTV